MDQPRPYVRAYYRVPVSYPAMFADASTIGEGYITSLSVLGCTLECRQVMPRATTVAVRLLLPDQHDSLPIEQAEVRWVQGRQVGLQFKHIERTANLRLHGFVWDRMLDRLRTITQQPLSSSADRWPRPAT